MKDIDLKDLIICHRCQTLHKKKPLLKNQEARCSECGAVLYKQNSTLVYKYLSFSITAIIFLSISLFFPILNINLSGLESSLNIIEAIKSLYESGYDIVAIFATFVLLIFPFIVLIFLFLSSLFMILKIFKHLTKWLLIIVGFLNNWSMLDIFFISILVGAVKIFDYASIEVGIAFYSSIVFILFEIYLTKHSRVDELWYRWESIYD